MWGFPKSTGFGKRITKQTFYEHLDISPTLKRAFVEQLRGIYWHEKLAVSTIHIAGGERVTEVEVLEVTLCQPQLDEAVLRQIDRGIPYHILFVLTFEGKAQAWIGYKQAAESGKNAFKVERYFHTDWMPEEALTFHIEGLDMDAVYENLVRQVAGDELHQQPDESLHESVERYIRQETLKKQIEQLEKKLRTEKQPKKKWSIHLELQKMKKEYLENCIQR